MASPTSNGDSFLDKHRDFVLKIKIGEDGTSQIRRVRLPRVAKEGQVCFDELVGLVISLIINPENPQNVEVKLTYKDVDDDTVVIGSSEELLDAIDQYSEQGLLRLTAEVKRCTKAKPQQEAAHDPSRASPNRASNHAATQAGNHEPAHPVLQNVVESVVDIILKAAVAVNGHAKAASSHPFYTPEGVETSSSEAAVAPSEAAAPVPTSDSSSETSPTENGKSNLKSPPVESPDTKPAPTVAEIPAEGVEDYSEEAGVEPEAEEEKPFIHGRHTCDACLTTPIVGKRYHAVNMADYDLCQKCFSNYKGSEIQFEAVELDRDRNLQDRWHRRRNRMNGGCQRRFGPPGHHRRWGPGRGPRGGRGPHQPPHMRGPRGQQGPRPHFPPPPPSAPHGELAVCPARPNNGNDGDLAMDEAIRRSLQDLMISQEEKPETTADPSASNKQEPVAETAAPEVAVVNVDSDRESNDDEESEEKEAPIDEERTEDKVQNEPKNADKESGSSIEQAESRTGSFFPNGKKIKKIEAGKDMTGLKLFSREHRQQIRKENPGLSMGEFTEVLEERWNGLTDEEKDEYKKRSTVVSLSQASDPVEAKMPSDDSFASGISVIEGEQGHEEEKEPTLDTLEPSFSSDAAGNGDVADLLGSTLDKCAKAIDAMVSELDRTPSHDESDCDSSTSSYVGVEEGEGEPSGKTEESAENTAADETDGATILEPNERTKEAPAPVEERSEEGWQVVTEDAQVSGDEELARAAQMVGSALFNSDMRSSGEIMSTLTGSAGGSEAFSYASSVPTSVPSVVSVSSTQLQRWATQLSQLHEMGFDDDAVCVEILERLTAANIGVDSDDEISVQHVLNELWRN